MAAREHVLGLVGEVNDMAAARHIDDDFWDVNDLVRTTVVVREVGTKALWLWISINRIMDIHKFITDIHKSARIMDIHNIITDIYKSILDIHNSIMDIHNQIMDIHKWTAFMDIHNSYL